MKGQMYVFILFAFCSFCCNTGVKQYQDLDLSQTVQLLRDQPDIQIIDLRTNEEIAKTGKINGALAMDFYDPTFKVHLKALDSQKPTMVYCAAGSRSSKASEIMVKEGFTTVYNFTGGMNAWKSKGYPTVPD